MPRVHGILITLQLHWGPPEADLHIIIHKVGHWGMHNLGHLKFDKTGLPDFLSFKFQKGPWHLRARGHGPAGHYVSPALPSPLERCFLFNMNFSCIFSPFAVYGCGFSNYFLIIFSFCLLWLLAAWCQLSLGAQSF